MFLAMNDPLDEPILEVKFGPFPTLNTKADLTLPLLMGRPALAHAPVIHRALELSLCMQSFVKLKKRSGF